ncbi:OsmC family protein [Alkalilimnicola sp. S0819]|nr:OsmC family protein [Alkalilimnicola sp. S0819]MPQ17382.1 OsmC family peroxiredoxin [Alkalilimnicola sp. S0819]
MAEITMNSLSGHVQQVRAGPHEWRADEPVAQGGDGSAPAPYELLLSALGACTAITLQMYARRKQWELGEIHLEMKFFMHEGEERIERVLRFGAALDDGQRARLLEIAGKTPVTRTVHAGTPIETRLA